MSATGAIWVTATDRDNSISICWTRLDCECAVIGIVKHVIGEIGKQARPDPHSFDPRIGDRAEPRGLRPTPDDEADPHRLWASGIPKGEASGRAFGPAAISAMID